jgi:hypothetical protein
MSRSPRTRNRALPERRLPIARRRGGPATADRATMTDRRPSRRRWSLRRIRLAAWGSVATAFISLVGVLGLTPKPASAEASALRTERANARPGATHHSSTPIVRHTVEVKPHRSVPVKVVHPSPSPSTAGTTTTTEPNGGSSSGGGGSTTPSGGGSTEGGGSDPAPDPAPASDPSPAPTPAPTPAPAPAPTTPPPPPPPPPPHTGGS